MNSHYILQLDPQAEFEWDRCILRNPLTGERPDLTAAIAKAVNNRAGSYLVKVDVQVEILESTSVPPKTVELTTGKKQAIVSDNRLAS